MIIDIKKFGSLYDTFAKNEVEITAVIKKSAADSAKKMGSDFSKVFSKSHLYKNKYKKAA